MSCSFIGFSHELCDLLDETRLSFTAKIINVPVMHPERGTETQGPGGDNRWRQ